MLIATFTQRIGRCGLETSGSDGASTSTTSMGTPEIFSAFSAAMPSSTRLL